MTQLAQDLPEPPIGLRRFASALRDLASGRDVDETLQMVVDLAAELVRGCDVADVMFIRRGGVTTPVSTGERARALDVAQQEAGEGPCISAAQGTPIVVSSDLGNDDRWPAFGPRAAATGINSAASYQLFLNRHSEDRMGALNLYGEDRDGFDPVSVELGEVFAAQCSAGLASAISREGFESALETRDLIGQAKGILMTQRKITADEAFELLRTTSQRRNTKLHEVARHVTEAGTLPT